MNAHAMSISVPTKSRVNIVLPKQKNPARIVKGYLMDIIGDKRCKADKAHLTFYLYCTFIINYSQVK